MRAGAISAPGGFMSFYKFSLVIFGMVSASTSFAGSLDDLTACQNSCSVQCTNLATSAAQLARGIISNCQGGGGGGFPGGPVATACVQGFGNGSSGLQCAQQAHSAGAV